MKAKINKIITAVLIAVFSVVCISCGKSGNEGKEKLNGKNVALYTSSYNTQVSYESNTDSENKATLDTIVYLKFYLDMHSKEVVKIQWDESKYDTDQQVLQKMCEQNLSETDARKEVNESGEYKVITTITITDRGKKISITKPDI